MANANDNVITREFKGSLGKQIVFRRWQGTTIVAKSPKQRSGNPTPAQVEAQDKFLIASRYAKSVTTNADPSLAEAYEGALRPRQNVYSRAMEDFLTPPEVEKFDTRQYQGNAGDKVIIRARDDFRVTGVWVELRAADGTLLESGAAVLNFTGIDWIYTATQANSLLTGTKIRATATDVPGNEGTLEITL